jgi:hypothetical protein
MVQWAKREEPTFQAHLKRGGQAESGWRAAGIGLAATCAVLLALTPLILVYG